MSKQEIKNINTACSHILIWFRIHEEKRKGNRAEETGHN